LDNVVTIDSGRGTTLWICEKWSEEAVEFARRKLACIGIERVPSSVVPVEIRPDMTKRERFASFLLRRSIVPARTIAVPGLIPIRQGIPSAILREVVGEPEECTEIKGNLLLNEGIQRLEDLTMIATVTNNQTAGNPWANANAQLGVGDSSTAEAATQTELQAATNRFYKAMNATYPSRSSQTVSFQSDFTTGEANYAWNEWTVATGSSGSPPSGTINLNRKVASLGTKASGTWTLTAQVAFS
jgi:hypothetical protein